SRPPIAGASNEISSSSRSITVCRRRAPMFPVRSFVRSLIAAEFLYEAALAGEDTRPKRVRRGSRGRGGRAGAAIVNVLAITLAHAPSGLSTAGLAVLAPLGALTPRTLLAGA